MASISLREGIGNSAFAFRGYNVSNLGRTPELLRHAKFGSIVENYLREASEICSNVIDRKVDLVRRVRNQQETELADYPESIALIVAVEQAQIQLLREFCDIQYQNAKFAFGFSLGEISALVAGDVYTLSDALAIPLAMSADGIELAKDVTLGVLFSRDESLDLDEIKRLFVEINLLGKGVIGMSAILSPNSILVLGSGSTMAEFRGRLKEHFSKQVHLRRNEYKWPPLHTPIVWERNIPNRSACMLNTLPGGRKAPSLPILSLVTGEMSYTDFNSREIIHRWIDHPQRLWDVVSETLTNDVETVIHVGPAPNIIPATFERLSSNVAAQTKNSRRMRALSAAVRRRWLQALLPKRASLLRATMIEHVVLEDWLLEQNFE